MNRLNQWDTLSIKRVCKENFSLLLCDMQCCNEFQRFMVTHCCWNCFKSLIGLEGVQSPPNFYSNFLHIFGDPKTGISLDIKLRKFSALRTNSSFLHKTCRIRSHVIQEHHVFHGCFDSIFKVQSSMELGQKLFRCESFPRAKHEGCNLFRSNPESQHSYFLFAVTYCL